MGMELSNLKYVRWSNRTVWEDYGGRTVVVRLFEPESMSPQTIEARTLNMEASDVWKLCDGTRTINDVISVLIEEYDVDRSVLELDVMDMIKQLVRDKFLILEDAPKKVIRKEYLTDERFKKSDNVIWNELEGRLYLMDTRTTTIVTLPRETANVWKLCDENHALKDIINICGKESALKRREILLLIRELELVGFITEI